MRRTLLAVLAVAIGALSGNAIAQEPYPSKPIKLIVPFTPGTGIDILARTLGQKMGDDWKTGVVVDNRPGASGNIGTEAVAKSPPDGYTLLMTASTIVLNRSLFKSIPYDPVKDFAPVAPLAIGRLALVTHPSVNAKTAKELIAFAKANPGKLFYGSPGNGTPHHLAMEVFKSEAGVDIVHVPYKGTSGAVQDLIGGQIGVMFLPVHVALPLVEAGKLNMLAAGGTQRASATPNVPSLAEAAGVRDIDTDIWYALYAPAQTPREIVTKLNGEMNAALKNTDVTDTLMKQGLQPTGGTPDQLEQLTRTDLERWAKVVRDAKIQPD
ncbi:MAG: tripartite tricarboxylate transporter substrate binding protein [Betaproteobacteria bacterium]|nr:MAG: tripartite tricarboxylate transporter substrate binding protein [Betaproteobacteria bacterium]TMH63866.1 MAG: tripartite tricarboxylate transporter substrate binding protein [Betaproteobacteria bacterium]